MVLVQFGHGKVVSREVRTKVDGKVTLVSELSFKGNPDNLAKSLVKMHGKEAATKIASGQVQDTFWKNVVKAVSKV